MRNIFRNVPSISDRKDQRIILTFFACPLQVPAAFKVKKKCGACWWPGSIKTFTFLKDNPADWNWMDEDESSSYTSPRDESFDDHVKIKVSKLF